MTYSVPAARWNHCADLGFDPAPGSTDTVRELRKKLADCARGLAETHGRVTKLLNGSYWEGDAAVAFREQLSGGPLQLNLKNAAHSLHRAARELERWEGELAEFQRRARRLAADAKDARAAAKGEPGATAELDKVIGRARKLAEEHGERAGYRAGRIRDATRRLAPHEPGSLDKFTDWLGDNLPDVLSACAAVLGVIALLGLTAIAPWVLFLAAGLLSGTAFGLRISDPEVMASLKDGIFNGEIDVDFWSNALGVTGDFLGMLPGLGAVTKGAMKAPEITASMTGTVPATDEVLTLGQRISRVGTRAGTSIRSVGTSIRAEAAAAEGAVSFLAHPRVFGGRLASIVEMTEGPATYMGAGTAVYGVTSSLVDGLDNDATKTTANFLDGPRTIGVDLPAAVGTLHFLLRGASEAS